MQPWQPPPAVPGWPPPGPPAPRRTGSRVWIAVVVAVVVLLVLPLVAVAGVLAYQQRQETRPPQSTYDDTRDLGQLVQRVAAAGPLVATRPVRFEVDRRSDGTGVVRLLGVQDALPGTPVPSAGLHEGNAVEVTGTYGAFCVTVTAQGERPVRWDSRWRAVQHGPSTDGACR